MLFINKRDAFNYLQRSKDKQLCVIAEDINNSGKKQYHVTKPKAVFDNIVINSYSHYYELWGPTTKMSFGIDLDIISDKITDTKDAIQVVKNTIIKVKQAAKDFYKHKYKIKDFIVLENNTNSKEKFSYHIICKGLTFENHMIAKDFFIATNDMYDLEFCDISIYNLTCFRLCYCSKKDKKAVLIPIEIDINDKKTFYMAHGSENELYNIWLQTWLTSINDNDNVITKNQLINKPKQVQNKNNTSNISNINLKEILFQLPIEYCDSYDKWTAIGMILANISTDDTTEGINNYYELWNEWSKQSDKYKEKDMKSKWKSFINNKTSRIGIGTLIKWCKDSGITNIFNNNKSIESICNSYPIQPIIIDSTNAIMLNQVKLTEDIFIPYLNKRLLAVQSEKGTGKTTNLFKALFESKILNDKTSILFISSRRTFGIKLLGDLEKYDFKLYSNIKDHYITCKRIICQIDSLCRLDRNNYDIVIVDECESLARYCTSQHFTKNNKANIIINTLEMRVMDAKNVYILDADLSNRCIDYYSSIIDVKKEDTQIIINEYKAYQDYSIITLKYGDWLAKVFEYITNKKKIVIPMASNNKAKDLLTKIQQDFPNVKALLIHKETSDEDKVKNVLNVNTTWSEYDIIIYTPSVSMGISFDIPNHFDAIFAYGCHNSVGAQEFCQMIHRVRHPKELNIYLSIDYYKEYNEKDDKLTFEIVEEMLCSDYYLTHYDLHNNILPKKVKHNDSNNIVTYYPYKEEPIYNLYVKNSKEVMENKSNFSASLYGYIKYKQYKIIYEKNNSSGEIIQSMKDIRSERELIELEKTTNGIFNAIDLTYDEFIQKIKQRDDYLNEEDVYAINKYNIKNCYKMEALTKDFIEEFYDKQKMKWYKNITTISNTDLQNTDDKLKILKENHCNNKWINNCYLDFTTKNNYIYHNYAITILDKLGFDINKKDVKIKEDDFNKSLDNCIDYLENHKQHLCYKFDMKITKLEDNKQKLKFINTIIFSMYGYNIKSKNNNYYLENKDVWNNIPRDDKVLPFDLKLKQNILNDFDTSDLDVILT